MVCIYKKIHFLTFDIDLGVKVKRNVAQYPLHHLTYLPTKFEVATSNGLGGDTFTRNVTDGRTHGQMYGRRTDFDTKLIYSFSKEKAVITNYFYKLTITQSSEALTPGFILYSMKSRDRS